MASSSGGEVIAGYSCEEWGGEYLLIEDSTVAAISNTSRQDTVARLEQHQCTDKSVPVHCDSLDSGYEGKLCLSRTCSPAETKETQSTAAQSLKGGGEEEEEEEEEEEWCIVEFGETRPQGLYGYRYVDYDDQEAEGNIHITDEDL